MLDGVWKWWDKTKKGLLELASIRTQVLDAVVPFLKGRPDPKQTGRTNYKLCEYGHGVAVSNTKCTHKTTCPAGCGLAEGEGHTAEAPQFTLLARKAKDAGEATWSCAKTGAQCPCQRFLTDIQISAEGVYSATSPANAAEINAKVDEIANAQWGKAVDKGRSEPDAVGLASARLCLTSIGCAGVVFALNPLTGTCYMAATPLANGEWTCECGDDLLNMAPCAKAAEGRCIGVLALLIAKTSRQRVSTATQASIDKITPAVMTPYLATASASSRKKQATSPPEGEIVSAGKFASQEASSRNAEILGGARNLINISLSLVRALGAHSARDSPPATTPSFINAAGDWAALSPIALEVFRCSFDFELAPEFEIAKLAAQQRRGVADVSIAGQQLCVHAVPYLFQSPVCPWRPLFLPGANTPAIGSSRVHACLNFLQYVARASCPQLPPPACAFSDALLRTGVTGNARSRTYLLKGVPHHRGRK